VLSIGEEGPCGALRNGYACQRPAGHTGRHRHAFGDVAGAYEWPGDGWRNILRPGATALAGALLLGVLCILVGVRVEQWRLAEERRAMDAAANAVFLERAPALRADLARLEYLLDSIAAEREAQP
jgi:hypothetical protein